MSTQDFLILLIDATALGFIAIASFDFIEGLIYYYRKRSSIVSPGQLSLFDIRPEPVPELPDPWELPTSRLIVQPLQKPPQPEQKLLLLPQAELETREVPLLDELLAGIDIDKLQIRPARKIAKVLGIAQKVNGRDQPLSWLRAQIKARLQQPQELPLAAIEAVRELLAS